MRQLQKHEQLFYTNGKIADEECLLEDKLAWWELELGEGKSVEAAEDYFTVGEGWDGAAQPNNEKAAHHARTVRDNGGEA